MRRWLPHPLLALALLAMWLLLNQSLSPGQLVLGGAVALLASHAMALLRPEPVRIRSVKPILPLMAAVLVDIVQSNVAVAKIVLSPGRRDRVTGFVRLPLDLTDRNGLAVLACIITATPGTMWVQYDRNVGRVLIHILDLIDEEEWVRRIKSRYERPLLAIFG